MISSTKILITKGLLLLAANLCYSQTWLPVGSGIGCGSGEHVRNINVSDNNEYLYITGIIGGNSNCNELRATLAWDGYEYHQMADPTVTVQASLAFDYLGNTYSTGILVPQSGNVLYELNYKDENGNWALVPNGFSGMGRDYLIRDGIVYIAGALGYCGGQPCGLVCTYDGEQVLPYYITNEPLYDYAYSLNFYYDTLYVAGNYTGSDGLHAQGYNKCCKIVNGQLEKVSNGFNTGGMCTGLEVLDEKLYISGLSRAVGFDESHSMYYYQNGQLHTLPEEPNGLIYSMTSYQNALYVAGDFTQIGNTPCNQVARWDGHEWTCLCHEPFQRVVIDENGDTLAVQPCMNQCIKDITVWNDTLYVGGAFHQIGNTTARAIAKLDMALSEAFPVHITEQRKQELKLNVYPNPTKHELNITLPLGADAKDIIGIYDVRGRLIKEQVAGKYGGNISIDVGTFSAGVYVLKYIGTNAMYYQSFIKE